MTLKRKARIWELWRQGKPMSVISKDIEKTPATVFSYLLYHGGIEPVARKRRADCLSFEEREVIAYAASPVICFRAPSTISRDISRNGGAIRYRACPAERAFSKRCRRPKQLLLLGNPSLREQVIQMLVVDW